MLKNGVLEKYFNESPEKLDPVYKEVIRLIYREEILNDKRTDI